MIELRNVVIHRGNRCLLRALNLHIYPGEILTLLGANGVGKTTLLRALAAEADSQVQGERFINQQAYHQLKPIEFARLRAVLPQSSRLDFDLSVEAVISMGVYPFLELSPNAVAGLTHEAIELTNTEAFLGRSFQALSGGEQQRVQFARTVLQVLASLHLSETPVYLFLDEPTSSLDPHHQQQLLACAQYLAHRHQVGVVTVLHDINLAAVWSDRLVLLADQDIIAMGAPHDVLQPQYLHQAFGVRTTIQAHPTHTAKPLVVYL